MDFSVDDSQIASAVHIPIHANSESINLVYLFLLKVHESQNHRLEHTKCQNIYNHLLLRVLQVIE